MDEHHNRLCRASLNQQHTKEALPPFIKKIWAAASVFAQSLVFVYFHMCVKMLLSKLFGGRRDKVIIESLFCFFSSLLSGSDVGVITKKQTVLRERLMPSDERQVQVRCWMRRRSRRKWQRGRLREHRFESRGDDWVNPRALSHPILSFTEQHRAEDRKGCEHSHMLLARSPSLMIWKGGQGQIELI